MDLSPWQSIQDFLADITGLPLALYDQKGDLLSSISGDNKLVTTLSESQKGRELFQNLYSQSITKAFKANTPIILKSPLNQHFFVVPLTLDEDNKFAIIGGHSFFSSKDFSAFMKLAEPYGLTPQHLSSLARDIKFNDIKVLNAVSRFVEINAGFMMKSLKSFEEHSRNIFRYKTLIEVVTNFPLYPLDNEVFEEIFHTLSLLFDVDSCSLMAWSEKECFNTQWVKGRIKDNLQNLIIKISEPEIKENISNGKPVFLTDTYSISKAGFTKVVESVGIFPLMKNKKPFALLNIFNTPMGNEEIILIQFLCKYLSYSVEYGTLKQKLNKKNEEFEMLREISKTLGSIKNVEELHQAIISKSTELLKAKKGSLMLLDSDGKGLVVKAIKGINDKLVKHLKVGVGEGITGNVFKKSKPVLVKDIENDPRFKKKNRSRYDTKSFICIPLKLNSRTIGVLNISDKVTGNVFSGNDLTLLQSFASHASVALEKSEFITTSEELIKLSLTDPLTGLWNKRSLQERLIEEIERSKRHGCSFSFLMIDIDNFKHINDLKGHQKGDEALKIVSKIIKDTVRAIDIIFRFGGEEFSVILPLTDKERASVIAERIRQEVENTSSLKTNGYSDTRMTLSIGLASFPHDGFDPNDLIKKADQSLYSAKEGGKNKVVRYNSGKLNHEN